MTQQLGLFHSDELARFAQAPLPDPDPNLSALAKRLPQSLRLGTSSWTFEGWQDLVYRRAYRSKAAFTRDSLFEYARHPLFRTVGIDRSFYAPLSGLELDHYRQQLPSGFLAVTKVHSDITSYRFPDHPRHGDNAGALNPAFLDAERFEQQVGAPTRLGLNTAAGPFLLQFTRFPGDLDPRQFETRLAHFLDKAVSAPGFTVELREARFLTTRYFDVLRHHGASHCFNYWEQMPSLRNQLRDHDRSSLEDRCPFWVIRLMLPPGQHYETLQERFRPYNRIITPQPTMRDHAVALVREGIARGKEVYVLVSNKAEGSSPETVRALAERLACNTGIRHHDSANAT